MDVNHPDLVGRIAGTHNAVDSSADVTDAVGHGTFVAGVAAATGNNGIGIAGASMGASILAVKVADAGQNVWSDAEVAGIIWAADHGAKVINLSLSSLLPDSIEKAAVAYAVGKGVLVVASAGNEANSTPNYPAAYPQVVAVGATNVATGARAGFSSFGSWVTVAAPGVRITGTTPTAGSADFPSTSGYSIADGTSFSAPIVAAEAALLWSLRPAVSAADIRQAIVASSHGYGNLGLGTGQVDFKAAYDTLRPDSVPTLTQPAIGVTVAGLVPLSATSAAPKVHFLLDGTPVGAPVATSAGVASTTWTSWGAASGSHAVTAVDCSLRDLCNAQATQMAVALANAAPVVTSPTASQMLTGSATLTATAPGGGVAFLIDGVRRGFDATAPYALTYPISLLSDTTHTISARGCSTSGTLCAGPASAPVSVTCRSVHPRITGLAPSLFSPNGDQRYDTTTVTYVLPDTEVVRFLVRSNTGTIVRSNLLGTLPAGTRAVAWNGLLNGGAPAGNGTYTLEIATTRGTLRGSAVAPVVVDNTRPTMTAIGGSATTFYPYPDAYRDRFAARATLSERARLTLSVHTTGGALVRALSGPLAGGATSITWDGKNTAGSRVPAGTYYWTLTAQDPAGNRRASARHTVAVNVSQLVTQTASLSRRGAQYFQAGGSDPTSSCASADKAHSGFAPNGVRLTNVCDFSVKGPQLAAAAFRFTLPAAISYSSLRLLTYGHSLSASTLGAGFTGWATGGFTLAPEITVGTASSWRAIGPVRAAGLVNAGRLVETTLYLPNEHPTNDYDVSDVRLIITYKVLG